MSILFFYARFLHLHTQEKNELKGTKSNTDARGIISSSVDHPRHHPLAKIESQGSRISSHSGSEESHGETKTKEATFGIFRKRYFLMK